jgi:hypothetical protein
MVTNMDKEQLIDNIYKTLINNINKMDKVSMVSKDNDTITIKQTNNKTIIIEFKEN